MSKQGNDPYLDNLVPNLHVLAPADFDMGVKTDPSVMALMMLSESKKSKDSESAKELLDNLQYVLDEKLDRKDREGASFSSSVHGMGVVLMDWYNSPDVKKKLKALGIDREVVMPNLQSIRENPAFIQRQIDEQTRSINAASASQQRRERSQSVDASTFSQNLNDQSGPGPQQGPRPVPQQVQRPAPRPGPRPGPRPERGGVNTGDRFNSPSVSVKNEIP